MKIAVMDSETDPFEYGSKIEPFVIGFYNGYKTINFWGDDCRERFIAHLETYKQPFLIYVHNGGKFDMRFFLPYLENKLHIQNNRIVKCFIGKHEFRDSVSIIPVALKDFKGKNQKQDWTDKDYKLKMSKKNRLKYKKEILEYLEADLLTLYEGVMKFREEFGDKLTIGSTSMKELQALHGFEKGSKFYDDFFRPYYFGGRNQCFKQGIIEGNYTIYDVNSMYPFVMKHYKHPVSVTCKQSRTITERTTFATIYAKNYGCLPVRTKTGLDFTIEKGLFYASIHEINAGLETGTLEILKVEQAIEHTQVATFETFVDHFYSQRLAAKAAHQDMLVTFYKLILNSAYGKFAQNPDNYKDYIITHDEIPEDSCKPYCPPDCQNHWRISSTNGEYFIWERPTERKQYFNVATAASITAAARAVLLRGLAASIDPIYCDTDSIICKKLNAEINPDKLGAWKVEGDGTYTAIAGKKLYAVFKFGECIKKASKGARISAEEINKIAQGSIVKVQNPVPNFKFNGSHSYISRTLKMTANAKPFQKPIQPQRKGDIANRALQQE